MKRGHGSGGTTSTYEILDSAGYAKLMIWKLPYWLGAPNKDFRYQITAIGAPAPNLHIAEVVISDTTTTKHGRHYEDDSVGKNSNNSQNHRCFKIAGDTLGMKVSWRITDIRMDPWANARRVQVEQHNSDKERGYYIHSNLYGQSADRGISSLHIPGLKVPLVTKNK